MTAGFRNQTPSVPANLRSSGTTSVDEPGRVKKKIKKLKKKVKDMKNWKKYTGSRLVYL